MSELWRKIWNPLASSGPEGLGGSQNVRAQSVNDRQAVERRRTSGLVQSIDDEFLIDPENKILQVVDSTGQERLLLGLTDPDTPYYGLKLTNSGGDVALDFNDITIDFISGYVRFLDPTGDAWIEVPDGYTIRFAYLSPGNMAAIRMVTNDLEINTGNFGGQDVRIYAGQDINLDTFGSTGYINMNSRSRASYLGLYEGVSEPTLAGSYAELYVDTADGKLKVKKSGGVVDLEASGGVTDHGALTGLDDDDHQYYVHLSNVRTITAVHTFNPGSPGAPFTLGANATGQLVSGLNADKLDSQEGSYYLNMSNHTGSFSTGGILYSPDGSSIGSAAPSAANKVPKSSGVGTWSWSDPPAGDHGALSGLSDDDHSQYVHMTTARSISAYHTFTNGFKTDDIAEDTVGHGVTIDSLNIKDGGITASPLNVTGSLAVSGTISEGGSLLSALYSAVGHTHNSLTGSSNLDFTISSTLRMRLQTTTYDLQVDGDVVAYSTVTGSDRRLKTEIRAIESGLSKVRALSGYTFLKRGRPGAGIIAQELAEVLPEAVVEKKGLADRESFLAIQVEGAVALLVEAVKELAERLETLELVVARATGRPI